MKVILLEDVVGAGNAGDVVEVKNGYARNKLLPAGTAIEANKTNMKTLEHRRAKIAAKKTADKEMAQILADKLDGRQVDFIAKAGDSGKLFGSVTAHDIALAVTDALGFEIDRRKLLLNAPIKEVGLHTVRYRVYPEVEAVIKVNIMAEGAAVPAANIEIVEVDDMVTIPDGTLDTESDGAETEGVTDSGEYTDEDDPSGDTTSSDSGETAADATGEEATGDTDAYDDEAVDAYMAYSDEDDLAGYPDDEYDDEDE